MGETKLMEIDTDTLITIQETVESYCGYVPHSIALMLDRVDGSIQIRCYVRGKNDSILSIPWNRVIDLGTYIEEQKIIERLYEQLQFYKDSLLDIPKDLYKTERDIEYWLNTTNQNNEGKRIAFERIAEDRKYIAKQNQKLNKLPKDIQELEDRIKRIETNNGIQN